MFKMYQCYIFSLKTNFSKVSSVSIFKLFKCFWYNIGKFISVNIFWSFTHAKLIKIIYLRLLIKHELFMSDQPYVFTIMNVWSLYFPPVANSKIIALRFVFGSEPKKKKKKWNMISLWRVSLFEII